MNIIDSVFLGMIAGLFTLKVLIMATATVLLVRDLARRPGLNMAAPAAHRRRLDVDI